MENEKYNVKEVLTKAFMALGEIKVSGRDVFRMATALAIIEDVINEINTPPEEGEEKEE